MRVFIEIAATLILCVIVPGALVAVVLWLCCPTQEEMDERREVDRDGRLGSSQQKTRRD